MKFTIQQDRFAKALGLVSRGISTRATLPTLSGVYLEVIDNNLILIGSNTEIALKMVVPVDGIEEGVFLVGAKLLTDFVLTLSNGLVEVASTEDILHIVSSRTKSQFTGMQTMEYPEVSFEMQPTHYQIPIKQMMEAVDRICFASSTDEARAVLTGVSMKAENGVMEMAATDGFRLSVEKFSSEALNKNFAVVVPSKVLQEVGKVLREYGGNYAGNFEYSISVEGSQLIFSLPSGILFVTRILEGSYPLYNKIIPISYATRVVFGEEELLKMVRTASLFARSGAAVLKMTIDSTGGLVKLSSATEQVGAYSGELSGDIEGSDNSIAFNSKYLLDFLSRIKSSKVVLEMNGSQQPSVWKILEQPDYLHVIMPVRTD